MGVKIERIVVRLPADFAELRAEAHGEGFRSLDRLAVEWEARQMRFEREGEMLLAARHDGILAGIGGITRDPRVSDAFRMRRFYTRLAFRRSGVARLIAEALRAHAEPFGRLITVNASASSHRFWEAIGFVANPRYGHTHVLCRASP